jgi:hypothetical protein
MDIITKVISDKWKVDAKAIFQLFWYFGMVGENSIQYP